MHITINNPAGLSNKVLRLIRWKVFTLKRKFQHLLYAEVHLKAEGQNPKTYHINVKLGIPGDDIVLVYKSHDYKAILKKINQSAHRYLTKNKATA